MKPIRYLLTIISLVILIMVAGCDNQNSTTSNNTTPKSNEPAQTEVSLASKDDTAITKTDAQTEITVYFPDANAEKLIAVKRQIPNNDNKYVETINALIAGPTNEAEGINVMPKGTKVLNVTINDKVATVDFNKEFQTNFTGGSTGEIMLIGSIVDTLTEFKEINAVRFTLEGQPLDILGGHLDLTEPVNRMNDLL